MPTATSTRAARTLRLTSPPMHGSDVELLQETVNAQLRAWDVHHRISIDGEYGRLTRDALRTVLHGLGIAQSKADGGVTPDLRVKLRHKRLTAAERDRYEQRAGWRKRLRARYEAKGPAAAILYARRHLGVTEQPPGSNSGPQITAWLRAVECPPAPWCGAFVNACLMAAGFPAHPWLRYCPWIEQRARAGEGGWTWHPIGDARPGDLVLYGARTAQHVGLYVGDGLTIEGNTSSGSGGSQDNGGGVFARRRDFRASAFPARGVARPPYQR